MGGSNSRRDRVLKARSGKKWKVIRRDNATGLITTVSWHMTAERAGAKRDREQEREGARAHFEIKWVPEGK